MFQLNEVFLVSNLTSSWFSNVAGSPVWASEVYRWKSVIGHFIPLNKGHIETMQLH